MTTPNIEELTAELRYVAKWAEHYLDKAKIVNDAADALDIQAGSIEAVQTVNARQAERIKALEAAPQVGYFYKWKDAMHGIAKLMDERDTLRAQLAEIEKAEPVVIALNTGTRQAVKWLQNIPHGELLFTRPMPMQDVTELVEALERIEKHRTTDMYWASGIARKALSKYKGAKG